MEGGGKSRKKMAERGQKREVCYKERPVLRGHPTSTDDGGSNEWRKGRSGPKKHSPTNAKGPASQQRGGLATMRCHMPFFAPLVREISDLAIAPRVR